MKKVLFVSAMAALAWSGVASAQVKINPYGLNEIDNYKMVVGRGELASPSARAAVTEAPMRTVLVTMAEGQSPELLEAMGYEVTNVVEDMAFVRVPLDKIEQLAAMKQVHYVDFGGRQEMKLDVAREKAMAVGVHEGTADGLAGTAYTGRGVTVGLYDTGLDPNHAAFRNPDGSSRVKAVYEQREKGSYSYTTPEEISFYTTDDSGESHGTHVLGIIAGSNNVQGKYAQSGKTGAQEGIIPYYGMAPEADIVVGCGDFYNTQILEGITNVVNKGVELDQPVVVNLSLGNNGGSHDPKSSTARLLDKLGEKAVICIAAGNEGTENMSITRMFTNFGSGKMLKTFFVPENDVTKAIRFDAEFWCATDEALGTKMVVYDKMTDKIVDELSVGNLNGSYKLWNTSSSSAMAKQYKSNTSLTIRTGVDGETNRYYVIVSGTIEPNSTPTYAIGINLSGSAGTKVYAYINTPRYYGSPETAIFSSEGVSGYLDGTPDGSINGFSCGYKMVSVGAYVSRTSAPYVGGGAYSYAGAGRVGDIANFSSYGETGDGRKLPHVCAPGAQIVSAYSHFCLQSEGRNRDQTNAYTTAFQRTNAYLPMQGTSMASPFVCGTIALWLQACPGMSVRHVQEIIEKTSIKDSYVKSSEGQNHLRWGSGKIDVLAGLKEAIKLNSSVNEVLADKDEKNLIINPVGDRNYNVCYVGTSSIKVDVYNMQGGKVLTASAADDNVNLDASQLASGVYVVSVVTPDGVVSRKYAVK